jgi:hypothetical protein
MIVALAAGALVLVLAWRVARRQAMLDSLQPVPRRTATPPAPSSIVRRYR